MVKSNLFFSYDINAQDLAKLGMSIGTSTSENFNVETDTCYHYTKFGKASLKFDKYLEPTKEFIKAVNDAIESKNPAEDFKKITDEYGLFISHEVILGGRFHFD